jgi:hypothetical protein
MERRKETKMKQNVEVIVAERNGISLIKRHTGFRTIEYFVEDRTGLPSIVCRCGDIYEAVKVFRKLIEEEQR